MRLHHRLGWLLAVLLLLNAVPGSTPPAAAKGRIALLTSTSLTANVPSSSVAVTPGEALSIKFDSSADGGVLQVQVSLDGGTTWGVAATLNYLYAGNFADVNMRGATLVRFLCTQNLSLSYSHYTSGSGVVTIGASSLPLSVQAARGATPTTSSVSASASSVQIAASDTTRIFVHVYNYSSANLYLTLGSGPAVVGQGIWLAPGGQYHEDKYSGAIYGIWDSATGNASVTKVTP